MNRASKRPRTGVVLAPCHSSRFGAAKSRPAPDTYSLPPNSSSRGRDTLHILAVSVCRKGPICHPLL